MLRYAVWKTGVSEEHVLFFGVEFIVTVMITSGFAEHVVILSMPVYETRPTVVLTFPYPSNGCTIEHWCFPERIKIVYTGFSPFLAKVIVYIFPERRTFFEHTS
jgi:hypothetical protein